CFKFIYRFLVWDQFYRIDAKVYKVIIFNPDVAVVSPIGSPTVYYFECTAIFFIIKTDYTHGVATIGRGIICNINVFGYKQGVFNLESAYYGISIVQGAFHVVYNFVRGGIVGNQPSEILYFVI